MTSIHPSSVIADGAILGAGVEIGPYCTVGPKVKLGDGTKLVSHVTVHGNTSIGPGGTIASFASIGGSPQVIKNRDDDTRLEVGARVDIREYVTMNTGTVAGGGRTVVGDDCLFMVGAHVAHDCILGDKVVLVNNSAVSGHCEVGDAAIVSGHSGLSQRVRMGRHAFLAGQAGLTADLIPFGYGFGSPARLVGLNLVGLKRRGFSREVIHDLRSAYRLLFANEGTFQERIEDVAEAFGRSPEVMEVIAFIRAGGEGRALCMPAAES